jgi:CHAT domain-containing protein
MRLVGKPQATVDNFRQLLQQCNNVLSSHHAVANLDSPLESSLQLGDGRITLGQIMSPGWRFKNLDEVFMSCCETNLGSQKTFADEPLTLTTGYLCAGARGVIGTLWKVDDEATALFSSIYHYYRRQGINRAAALQIAQSDLRSTQCTPVCFNDLLALFQQQREESTILSKQAKSQIDSLSPDTSEYLHWKSVRTRASEQKFAFMKLEENLQKLGTPQNPFQSPFYWAAFTCNGIG